MGFEYDKYAYFVLEKQFVGRGSNGFTGYDVLGDAKYIWDGRTDNNGNQIPRKFKFSAKERTMRIPLNQKDKNGNSVVTFLSEHPGCKGSPNADPRATPFFSRLDLEGDASVAVDAKIQRIDAENFALALEHDEAIDMAVLFGTFTDKYKTALHVLLEQAGNDAEGFMEIAKDGAIAAKVLLKKALDKKLFVKKGGMIKWEGEVIGADEDSAIQRLMRDEDLYKSVEINIKK
jgi:hypothetical protein